MREYPVYKHLIQFSNMVDADGNFIEHIEAEYKKMSEQKRPVLEDKSDDDSQKEGGSAYEGGDSDNGLNGNANGTGEKLVSKAGSNGVKPSSYESQEGREDLGGMQRNYYQVQQNSNLPSTANPSKWRRNYDNLSTQDRQEMLVDEIFALYLYRMSNRINQFYYKIVLAYVIFFRECLNEYGWGKKIESEGIRLENNPELKMDIETK
jgi:hypothetical protein